MTTTATGPWIVSGEEHRATLDERDRARATAVRLEQQLARTEAERDALAEGLAYLHEHADQRSEIGRFWAGQIAMVQERAPRRADAPRRGHSTSLEIFDEAPFEGDLLTGDTLLIARRTKWICE